MAFLSSSPLFFHSIYTVRERVFLSHMLIRNKIKDKTHITQLILKVELSLNSIIFNAYYSYSLKLVSTFSIFFIIRV